MADIIMVAIVLLFFLASFGVIVGISRLLRAS